MDNKFLYCKAYAYSSILDVKMFLLQSAEMKNIVYMHNRNNSSINIEDLDGFIRDVFFFEDFSDEYVVVSFSKILTKSNNARIVLYPFTTDSY